MTLFVGLDDTDSRRAMCTTFVATEIVARFRALGWDLLGHPRLVRLNPNIPWKTRGNGALCLRFGRGVGPSRPVGGFPGWTVRAYPSGRAQAPDEALLRAAQGAVLELADLDDRDAQPGLVVTRARPAEWLYWRAVRGVVAPSEIARDLERADLAFAPKGPRGLIGALASLAWRPKDATFEVLAYRARARWGAPREIAAREARRLEDRFPRTFNNYDEEEHHVAIAPRSPCPVLFGIRGEDPDELPLALATVRGEPLDRWVVFETNQGTDDHLVACRVEELRPHTSAILEGRVSQSPRTTRGGHVVVPLTDGTRVDCVAYEPSKSFRRIVRLLHPGDHIRAYGSIRERPWGVNLEKLEVLDLIPETVKLGNPRCPHCQKSMNSRGRRGGYRCRRCGSRAASEEACVVPVRRALTPGWYEPPVSARRHLSKPLKRIGPAQDAFATVRMESARMSIPASSSSSSMVKAGM